MSQEKDVRAEHHKRNPATEIREHGNAEQKLREDRDYLRQLTNSLPDAVVSVTLPDRKIAWANDAVKVLGYKPEECIGMSTRVFFPTQEDYLAFADKVTRAIGEGQDVLIAESFLKKKSGELFAAEVTLSYFKVNGTAVSETVILRDITESQKTASERNQLRNELAHLSRVMTMSELSATLAHEINQPLGAIQNNAAAAKNLISMFKEDHAEFDEILTDIVTDAMRASQIIRTARGIVRKEEAKFEQLNLNVLIEEVVELYRNAFNMENTSISLDLHPDIAPVKGNRVRLQQVLMNLVSNASEAMRESPSKRLRILSNTQSTDLIVASVSDSGKGIDKTMKGKIFQSFFTTKKGGLGVGLRICQSIIEEHGGRIWVENNPAGGATFSFSLKAYQGGSE